jgi:transcriptional regulator with XRE-family HTH domain
MARSPIPPLHLFLGANVQRLRRSRGLTQEQLAVRLRVDVRYLRRVERGTIDIRLVTLARLAWVFEVSASRLLRAAALPVAKAGRPRPTRRTPSKAVQSRRTR